LGEYSDRNSYLVVNVNIEGSLFANLGPSRQTSELYKENPELRSMDHSDTSSLWANIDPGGGYLNGGRITASLNLGNELSFVTSKS
jgi:hypothetical protein